MAAGQRSMSRTGLSHLQRSNPMTVFPRKSLFLPTACGTIERIPRTALRAVVITFALWLFSGPGQFADAQDIFGRISGTVTDSSGGTVAGAKVTISNEATLIAREITADKNGYFAADQLPAGIYSVSGEQSGFKITTKKGNMLAGG